MPPLGEWCWDDGKNSGWGGVRVEEHFDGKHRQDCRLQTGSGARARWTVQSATTPRMFFFCFLFLQLQCHFNWIDIGKEVNGNWWLWFWREMATHWTCINCNGCVFLSWLSSAKHVWREMNPFDENLTKMIGFLTFWRQFCKISLLSSLPYLLVVLTWKYFYTEFNTFQHSFFSIWLASTCIFSRLLENTCMIWCDVYIYCCRC